MATHNPEENEGQFTVRTLRVKGGVPSEADDLVAVEAPLVLKSSGATIVTLMYTPPGAGDLALGYLLSEGVIKSMDDVRAVVLTAGEVDVRLSEEVKLPEPSRTRVLTSGCGGGVSFSQPGGAKGLEPVGPGGRFTHGDISELMKGLGDSSPLFGKTGGTHSAALFCGGTFLTAAEDIGRHNAVDKAIGAALASGADMTVCALGVTGRVSSEILLKCVRAGIPVVVSRGAPTSLAVELAGRFGVTLAGFARGNRFNVYSNEHRIRL